MVDDNDMSLHTCILITNKIHGYVTVTVMGITSTKNDHMVEIIEIRHGPQSESPLLCDSYIYIYEICGIFPYLRSISCNPQ